MGNTVTLLELYISSILQTEQYFCVALLLLQLFVFLELFSVFLISDYVGVNTVSNTTLVLGISE